MESKKRITYWKKATNERHATLKRLIERENKRNEQEKLESLYDNEECLSRKYRDVETDGKGDIVDIWSIEKIPTYQNPLNTNIKIKGKKSNVINYFLNVNKSHCTTPNYSLWTYGNKIFSYKTLLCYYDEYLDRYILNLDCALYSNTSANHAGGVIRAIKQKGGVIHIF